jgi:hypothetical protein
MYIDFTEESAALSYLVENNLFFDWNMEDLDIRMLDTLL